MSRRLASTLTIVSPSITTATSSSIRVPFQRCPKRRTVRVAGAGLVEGAWGAANRTSVGSRTGRRRIGDLRAHLIGWAGQVRTGSDPRDVDTAGEGDGAGTSDPLNDIVFRYNSAAGKAVGSSGPRGGFMRRFAVLATFAVIVLVAAMSPLAQRGPTAPVWPGYKGDGVTLLPNGWRIAPEGRHLTVGDLPMNLVPSPDGRRLYATEIYGQKVRAVDLEKRQVIATADLAAEPYTCVLSADGATLFVSLWGGVKVLMLDPGTLASKGEIAVGEHPNAMTLSRDGARLFVACANTNAVWVVDLARKTAAEQISVALGTEI